MNSNKSSNSNHNSNSSNYTNNNDDNNNSKHNSNIIIMFWKSFASELQHHLSVSPLATALPDADLRLPPFRILPR